jgi:ABC-2 type transport system permease protein
MIFLCGLFIPVEALPAVLQPVSYALPLTYGVDILHGAMHGAQAMPLALDFSALSVFCVTLFALSVWNIHRRWIR